MAETTLKGHVSDDIYLRNAEKYFSFRSNSAWIPEKKLKTIFYCRTCFSKFLLFYTRAADYINFSSRGICFLFADVFFSFAFLDTRGTITKDDSSEIRQHNQKRGFLKVLLKSLFTVEDSFQLLIIACPLPRPFLRVAAMRFLNN